MMKIKLNNGDIALVDKEDYEKLNKWKWKVNNHGYVCRSAHPPGSRKTINIYMHRFIINPPDGLVVDHVNRNPLDNRRCNLRLATRSQNQGNRKMQKNNKSGYHGVNYSKMMGKWRAEIKTYDKRRHLGFYGNIEDAAKAYDDAAIEYFGEFARLNFPERKECI